MAAFHQMGYQSDNLLALEQLSQYRGAILSPVNYNQEEMSRFIGNSKDSGFEIIFDPQMYYPKSQKGKLPTWKYFPNDFYTADLLSFTWWNQVTDLLADVVCEISADAVCSPIPIPKVFQNEYYATITKLTNPLYEKLAPQNIAVLQTVMINLADLSNYKRVHEIASIVTQTKMERIYLLIHSQTPPRRELSDSDELKGAMLFIRLLEDSGIKVLVGYCSSDIILWKEAGATDCATGKFFNLRRFTPSRWIEDEEGGGGQLPYWFEESLVAYLRESDIARVQSRTNIFSEASKRNPFATEIQQNISNNQPWLGLSWRHYLYWFAEIESRFMQHEANSEQILSAAEKNWIVLDNLRNPRVLMEERTNTGEWIRQWLRAILEYEFPW